MNDRFVQPGAGHRPSTRASLATSSDLNPPPPSFVSQREYRVKHGLDIWTGKPLKGEEATHWLRSWSGLPERPVPSKDGEPADTWGESMIQLIEAGPSRVVFLRQDWKYVELIREVTVEKVQRQDGLSRRRRVVKVTVANVWDSMQFDAARSA